MSSNYAPPPLFGATNLSLDSDSDMDSDMNSELEYVDASGDVGMGSDNLNSGLGPRDQDRSLPKPNLPGKDSKATGSLNTNSLDTTSTTANPNTVIDADVTGQGSKSTHLQVETSAMALDPTVGDAVDNEQDHALDLANQIKGLYRVLDLISEQGSGGLVDKVIIAQKSLALLVNALSPGAYKSLTKLDFKALDKVLVKPIGIYGSQEEIVEFFLKTGAVDETTAQLLKSTGTESDDVTKPVLRSGLYVLRPATLNDGAEQLFVIYWPESSTWDDKAVSSVRRNRVTFMRYLTKICDHIVAMVSVQHLAGMKWADANNDDDVMDIEDDDEEDRMFTFEVAKTNEQEEGVTVENGFSLASRLIVTTECPDSSIDVHVFKPRLLNGETRQGVLCTKYIAPSLRVEVLREDFTDFRLRSLFVGKRLQLLSSVPDSAVATILRYVPHGIHKTASEAWKGRNSIIEKGVGALRKSREDDLTQQLQSEEANLKCAVGEFVACEILKSYPIIAREQLVLTVGPEGFNYQEYWAEILSLYPPVAAQFEAAVTGAKLKHITDEQFRKLKKRLTYASIFLDSAILSEEDRVQLLDAILERDDLWKAQSLIAISSSAGTRRGLLGSLVAMFSSAQTPDIVADAQRTLASVDDPHFLSCLHEIGNLDPMFAPKCAKAFKSALKYLNSAVKKLVAQISSTVQSTQLRIRKEQIRAELGQKEHIEKSDSRMELFGDIMLASSAKDDLPLLTLESFETRKFWGGGDSHKIVAKVSRPEPPALEYSIHQLETSTDHQHELQLDPHFIPSPQLETCRFHTFCLPMDHVILHAQMLEREKLILIVDERNGRIVIYCEPLASLDGAIRHQKPVKVLNRDKIGDQFTFAIDENKRLLAVCASQKFQLNIMAFDETFVSLRAVGSAVDLSPWYHDHAVISQSCFVSGSEELLLLDSNGNGRIFSLITQQFRPASIHLADTPASISSTPDGSCLLVSYPEADTPMRAFHWATFGSSDGIVLEFPQSIPTVQPTSLVKRSNVHLVCLDLDRHLCYSFALRITSKITEFMFTEKNNRQRTNINTLGATSNCLIDCHPEVWTRFPVVAAVPRYFGATPAKSKSLTFITRSFRGGFPERFEELIQSFEQLTRKPTNDELSKILVSEIRFDSFIGSSETHNRVSSIPTGEWLMHVLCLIPIHLAVTRENRFVPLKDGVSSSSLEKSLLGAEVGRIVESLSVGWYEAIFQSYMASKPVKVVSSMGEQSVGKSFALNHMVDTSFAGSAMRTTEGVWMSVTPTQDALIVALDFEGVHSIERSAQEDTLLVLFNTAISNLVLFRNNFALSRDISGLFQSFQSSSTVLDPAANPSLFQSTLAIIIKDVVESDKNEITKEFSLKFQKIVQDQQAENFITKLHAGKLNIIPWPVIESRQFYKLFPSLKKRLDQQPVTHPAAGEFLLTLKTLMAKLKANDWGALDQTLAAHRAHRLLQLLPCALEAGYSELELELEQLKNFDTDQPIDSNDHYHHLILTNEDTTAQLKEVALAVLRESFPSPRQVAPDDSIWLSELSQHLGGLVDIRVNRVLNWIDSNLSRFKAGHANIEDLRRRLDNAIIDIKGNIQLCGAQCKSCHLLCVRARLHDGVHNCTTTHKCLRSCDFVEEHVENNTACGYSAGHTGPHICDPTTHLCGQNCPLKGKPGCLGKCTKVAEHPDGEHICSALRHMCGEPCALSNITFPNSKQPSCTRVCDQPSDREHFQHACSNSACPFSCALCKRLCANNDHLHGMDPKAVHLCGQEHPCGALCQESGICEIDTAPQSIEATFTGRHETFEYTKYSQVAKRLKCMKPIEVGRIEHKGPHIHSLETKPFHFCETRCESCGYFCTLPRGHPQKEHETHHGSMSKTRWAIDGSDDAVLEVNGKRFAANDDGAPMMCNLVCQAMGRHIHVDYCRTPSGQSCSGADLQHCPTRMLPNPDRPKDIITHGLYWQRSGFKDPYPKAADEKSDFSKCDAMCSGPEHSAAANGQPSYCTLPHFHPPATLSQLPRGGLGYVSNDGHSFRCKNPAVMQQAFHVLFVIDRSSSMGATDRRPLGNTPSTATISRRHNNRLGAVYSSLHSFWTARHAAVAAGPAGAARRDAYSVILFESHVTTAISNDFTSTPDQLLNILLGYSSTGGTNYTDAVKATQTLMSQNWSTERSPVVVFLSDGECSLNDQTVQDLGRAAVAQGKPLSLHTVSFGPERSSAILRRMAQIALEIQNNAPRDPLAPAAATVLSSYSEALNTIQLAETFLGLADSLRKPRGSLLY